MATPEDDAPERRNLLRDVRSFFTVIGYEWRSRSSEASSPTRIANGLLLQMAGDLISGALACIEEDNFYAAAALGRQLLEITDLVKYFIAYPERATYWLSASDGELRKASDFKLGALRNAVGTEPALQPPLHARGTPAPMVGVPASRHPVEAPATRDSAAFGQHGPRPTNSHVRGLTPTRLLVRPAVPEFLNGAFQLLASFTCCVVWAEFSYDFAGEDVVDGLTLLGGRFCLGLEACE